ncbi:MAG TPA: hypothetical protein VN803_08550, partial [Gemmatimonadales bacterium]|nr:hypothetical protein [Gemmatimonadales bacterium]
MVLLIGLLAAACASSGNRQLGALGWSLGGEAHVFVASDRYARDFYRELTGIDGGGLSDSLARRALVAVDARKPRSATVLSASGAAPARLTLARFHARGTCGYSGIVTELVLAFPPGGTRSGRTPPSHVTVVALLEGSPFAASTGAPQATLTRAGTRDLINRVAQRAESASRGSRATLVRQLTVDDDQAADAGEVVPFGGRYAVGFRARYVTANGGTLLITGVASTDLELRDLRWVTRPQRLPLRGGMITGARADGKRYSLR